MTRDCGVGSSADMPKSVWVVVRELNANPFDQKPIAAFCNKRYAEFWVKNQSEEYKRKYTYFVYPSVGNPECNESVPGQ